MANAKKPVPRKPATKFPQLQKKLRQLSAGKGQKSPKFHELHRDRFLREL